MATFDLKDAEQLEKFIGQSRTELELTNGAGDTATIYLEPLDCTNVGKLIKVQNIMPKAKLLNPKEVKAGREPKYESMESLIARMKDEDYNAYGEFFNLLVLWVKQTNPAIPDAALRKIILTNFPVFAEAFTKQHSEYDPDTKKSRTMKEFIEEQKQKLGVEDDAQAESETTQTTTE